METQNGQQLIVCWQTSNNSQVLAGEETASVVMHALAQSWW